jgi:hypothetical protein
MWRFLLSAGIAMAVLIALFASDLGDAKSLPHVTAQPAATVRGDVPSPVAPRDEHELQEATLAVTQQRTALETLQREVADLQRQSAELQELVMQRSQELEDRTQKITAARGEADELQAAVAALRQQRASLLAAWAHQRQAAATGRTAAPGSASSQALPAAIQPLEERLLTARQSLAAGRPDEARRLLAEVQTQMVLRPVSPERPSAEGGNVSATDVGYAIRWLDIGANGQAARAIDRAVAHVRADAARSQQPPYPAAPPAAYGEPGG